MLTIWNEMKWNEMKWNEIKRNESANILIYCVLENYPAEIFFKYKELNYILISTNYKHEIFFCIFFIWVKKE